MQRRQVKGRISTPAQREHSAGWLLALTLCIASAGCGDGVRLPSQAELAEFHKAGPVLPDVDMTGQIRAAPMTGPYRVVPGDVLEVTMPAKLATITADTRTDESTGRTAAIVCRVDRSGAIMLPVVGALKVAGRSLSDIDAAIVDAYYPKYTVGRPSIYAHVVDYSTHSVSITGAVRNPGIYELRSDRMSLSGLIMASGGILEDGAAKIEIIRAEPADAAQTAHLPQGTTERECDPAEIQLSFTPTDSLSSQGLIFAKRDGQTLLARNIDVSSEHDRLFIAEILVSKRVCATAIDQVKQRLNQLAQTISDRAASANGVSRDPNDRSAAKQEGRNQISTTHSRAVERTTSPVADAKRRSIILPVRGYNILSGDVPLSQGDTVIVERLSLPLFTVIGLVDKGGNSPYPPGAHYNLMQAIAFAGGLDRTAEPRYATIYRLKADGTIVHVTLELVSAKNGAELTDAFNTAIKPGDIIAIEHTPRTRANAFLDRVFRINFGVYAPLDVFDQWP